MHIVRWLFGNPIAFAWILALFAILLNWGIGGRSHQGEEVHQAEQAEHSTVADASGHTTAGEAPVAAEQNATAEQAAVGGAEQSATAEQAAVGSVAAGQAADTGTSAGGGEGAQAAQALMATTAVAGAAVVAEQAAASASVTEQAATSAGAAVSTEQTVTVSDGSAEDLLLAAREAYWGGELDRSVEFYQSLLKKYPQPDYKGELANVYWKEGKSAEAVALYAEIAPWMAEQGRMAELNNMKVYADLVDSNKAAEIAAWIK